MTHPFVSGNPSSGFLQNHSYSGSFPLPGFVPAQKGHQHQSYSLYPSGTLQNGSSGNSDLEILERLKREILAGQNPHYTAVPQPAYLESLYLGRSSSTGSLGLASFANKEVQAGQVEKLQKGVQTEDTSVIESNCHGYSPINDIAPSSQSLLGSRDNTEPLSRSSSHVVISQSPSSPIKDDSVDDSKLPTGKLSTDLSIVHDAEMAHEDSPVSTLGTRKRLEPSDSRDLSHGLKPSEQRVSVTTYRVTHGPGESSSRPSNSPSHVHENDRKQNSSSLKHDSPLSERGLLGQTVEQFNSTPFVTNQHDTYEQSLERQSSQAQDERETRTFYEGQSEIPISSSSKNVDTGQVAFRANGQSTPVSGPLRTPQKLNSATATLIETVNIDKRQVPGHMVPPEEERKRPYNGPTRQSWSRPSDPVVQTGRSEVPSDRLFLTAEETRALESQAMLHRKIELVPPEDTGESHIASLEERIGARVCSPDREEARLQASPVVGPLPVRTIPLHQRISGPPETPVDTSTGLPPDFKPSALLEAIRKQSLTDLINSVKQEPVDVPLYASTSGSDSTSAPPFGNAMSRGSGSSSHETRITSHREPRPANISVPRSSYPAQPQRTTSGANAELVPREGYNDANTVRKPFGSYPDDRRKDVRRTDIPPSGDFARPTYRPGQPYRERDRVIEDRRPGQVPREWRERASYPPSNAAPLPPPPPESAARYVPPPVDRYDDRGFKPASNWQNSNSHFEHERGGLVERDRARAEWHSNPREHAHRPVLPPSSSQRTWSGEDFPGEPLGGRSAPDMYALEERTRRDSREHYPLAGEFMPAEPPITRSPSPYRRGPPQPLTDNLRPNKRTREEMSYYDIPERRGMPPAVFQTSSPTPPSGNAGGGYDPRAPLIIPRNESTTYPEPPEQPSPATYYDRPPYPVARTNYVPPDGLDERRYRGPPRTA